MSPTKSSPSRRSLRVVTPLIALGVALMVQTLAAVPAHADVPIGWSNPDPVSPLTFLFVVVGAPVALVLLIALVVLTPGFSRGEGLTGKNEHADDRWFGGSRNAMELESGTSSKTSEITGGASGSW